MSRTAMILSAAALAIPGVALAATALSSGGLCAWCPFC
jgi:hypothetical protein